MSNNKKAEEKQEVNETFESDDSLSLTQLLSRKEVLGQTKRTKAPASDTTKTQPQKRRTKSRTSTPAADEKALTYTIDTVENDQSSDVPGVTKLLQRQSYLQYVKEKTKKESTPEIKATKRPLNEKRLEDEDSTTATIVAAKPSPSAPTPPPIPPVARTSVAIPKIPLPKPALTAIPRADAGVTPTLNEQPKPPEPTTTTTTPALQIKAQTRRAQSARSNRPALLRWKAETLARAEAPFLKWLNLMMNVGANSVLYLEPLIEPGTPQDGPMFFARAALTTDAMAAKLDGLVFQTNLVRELFKRVATRGWLELSASNEAQSPAYSLLRQIFFAPTNQFMTMVCFPKEGKVGAVCVFFSDQSIETKAMRLLQSVSHSAKKTTPKAA